MELFARREILSLRNDLLRNNWFWRILSAMKTTRWIGGILRTHVRESSGARSFFEQLPSFESKRPIAETDLYAFRWIASPRYLAGRRGHRLYPGHREFQARRLRYLALDRLRGGGPARPLTSGPRDSGPRWSPDGKSLAFLRAPEPKEGKPQPAQIYLLSMEGGEARPLTDIPKGRQPCVGARWPLHRVLVHHSPKDFDKKSMRKRR
jgi:hypothetical protein